MASRTVSASDIATPTFTLAGSTVDTVTFTNNIGAIEIISDGAAAAYYTVDGTTPTIDGTNTYLLPAGVTSVDTRPTVNSGGSDVVKIISAGTPSIRVQACAR